MPNKHRLPANQACWQRVPASLVFISTSSGITNAVLLRRNATDVIAAGLHNNMQATPYC